MSSRKPTDWMWAQACELIEQAEGKAQQIKVGRDDLAAILGPRQFEAEVTMRSGVPGVAINFVWTERVDEALAAALAVTPGDVAAA
jgi:ATP-dependent Lon protease